ncbi:MAG: methylmalonyl Co-A mutase-associated GTPase MeaB [Bacteroidota bacterium]|nr:methylmalonyl Co-A mutase-associated GTPase MeaB [Bacteroidota bacterium]
MRALFEKIRNQDRKSLSEAITILESQLPKDKRKAIELIEKCFPLSGDSIRIGITGPPGSGKSTFIEEFGSMLTKIGNKVAVLAIDPSSSNTKGSILGDKTRMIKLANDENAFIRPSAARDTLGGISSNTKESIILCETAGFNIILVETVGVGQSESYISNVVDFCLLLKITGAGDELQTIKRGLTELADAIIITKADGDNIENAKQLSLQYKNTLNRTKKNGWQVPINTCSSYEKTGLNNIWKFIQEYRANMMINNFIYENRKKQDITYLHILIKKEFGERKYIEIQKKQLRQAEKNILENKKNVYTIIKEINKNI